MKKKKGFTLIELLAVIVILAIIALIATPIVLNMINSARRSSAKSSTLGFIDSIEYYAGFHQAKAGGDLGIEGYEKEVPTEICKMENKTWKTCSEFMTDVKTKSKGSAPTDAEIAIDASGKVQANSWMKYNEYTCKYDGKDVECSGNGATTSPSAPTVQPKEYSMVDDKNSNGIADIGDEIAIGNEHFYVISNSNKKINALAKYNLSVGNMCTSTSSCTPISNTTGLQDAKMTGLKDGVLGNGSVNFSNINGWSYANNETIDISLYDGPVKNALSNYKIELEKTLNNVTVRLITKTEIDNLLNDGNPIPAGSLINDKADAKGYSWIYSISFWTASAYSSADKYVWCIFSNGKLNYGNYALGYNCGVRPVIEINA